MQRSTQGAAGNSIAKAGGQGEIQKDSTGVTVEAHTESKEWGEQMETLTTTEYAKEGSQTEPDCRLTANVLRRVC